MESAPSPARPRGWPSAVVVGFSSSQRSGQRLSVRVGDMSKKHGEGRLEEHQQAAARASARRQGWGSSRPGSWKERVIGPDFWADKTLAISGLLVVEEHAEQRSRRGGRDALVLLRCRRLAVALSSPSEKLVVVAVVRGQAGGVRSSGPGPPGPGLPWADRGRAILGY